MPKVLVADDSIAVRKVAERLLTEAGIGVTLAANGEEALAMLAKESPDLIVSDVIMPDKSGYEVCAFIRAQTALAKIPVLLISGIVNDEVTKQAESCRADGVLKKPFQGTSLKDRVLELLAKRQSQSGDAPKTAEKIGEKGAASVEETQGTRVATEQLEVYREAVAKLKQVEEELKAERSRALQLEGQLGRVKELESMLQREREEGAQARKSASELAGMSKRVAELESLLKAERDQTAQIKKRASDIQELEQAVQKERNQAVQQTQRANELQKSADRAKEFEAALQAERQAATQLVQQMTAMEKTVVRSQELSQQLAREQERASELARRLAVAESGAARVISLEQALEAEKKKTVDLSTRLSGIEHVPGKTAELETLLNTERERNSLLTKRVSETERAAEQATKRFEEMAKKLGEIAGLASQLGSGKRRS